MSTRFTRVLRRPRRRPLGHGRHPREHRAVLDGVRVRPGREVRRHLDARGRARGGGRRPDRLGDLHARAHGDRPDAGADRRGAPRRGRARWSSARCPGRPGARELLAELRSARRAVRAGHDVVEKVRRAGAPGPAGGVLRRAGVRRRGRSREAAPRALPAGRGADRSRTRARPSPSRTRRPAPPRRLPPAVRCWSSRATSPSRRGSDARTARRWSGSRRQIWQT